MDSSPPHGNGAATPIVEARDVRRLYDTGKIRVNALNGVTLSVAAGEMLAIMSPGRSLNLLPVLTAVENAELPLLPARRAARVYPAEALRYQ